MSRNACARIVVLVFGITLWFIPHPEGVTQDAWHLAVVFVTAILAIITKALPILTAAIFALVAAVFTRTVEAETIYLSFANPLILLIVITFLFAVGVVNSGLGRRIAYLLISRLGKTSLGLGYSMAITDAVIAPAFPSNTARSGVLYPITYSLAVGSGSKPDEATRKKIGSYLMMNGMAGLTISSALWLTAMAANPTGAGIAFDEHGIEITFASWLLAASVPALAALAIIPYLLYRVFPPDRKKTPEAPAAARKELKKMGPLTRHEWVTGAAFLVMVLGWAFSETLDLDKTAIAFFGLGVLLVSGVITLDDVKKRGSALSILIWFAILFALGKALNDSGFTEWLGTQIAQPLEGLSWPIVYLALIAVYVTLHYLFVSQTAQMVALYAVFLNVGITAGIPPAVIAYMLLFATNFFAAITPQGSSANVIFVGSGYLTQGEVYRNGAIVTYANMAIFLVLGTPWLLLVT